MEGGLIWLGIIAGILSLSLLALGVILLGRRRHAADDRPPDLDGRGGA